jgi:peptidase inhibitor family I36
MHAKEKLMKTLVSVICTGLFALSFAACAGMAPGDDTAADDPPSDDPPAVEAAAIPAGSQALAAEAVAAGVTCTAFAVPGGGGCPSGFTCLWKDSGFRGEIVGVSRGCVINNLPGIPCPSCSKGNFNDQMSSWANFSGGQSCWWFDVGRKGARTVMPNGVSHSSTLSTNNDKASSFGSC